MRIVPCSLLRIGKYLVGHLNFSEKPCGLLDISIVAIGVQLERFSPIGLFNAG